MTKDLGWFCTDPREESLFFLHATKTQFIVGIIYLISHFHTSMLYVSISATLSKRAHNVGLEDATDVWLAHLLRLLCGVIGAILSGIIYRQVPNEIALAMLLAVQAGLCTHVPYATSHASFYVETALFSGLCDMSNTGLCKRRKRWLYSSVPAQVCAF